MKKIISMLDKTSYKFIFTLCFFVSLLFFYVITVPFQSPDEFVHYFRAYSLATWQLFPENNNIYIDRAFLELKKIYDYFPFHYGHKLSIDIVSRTKEINWVGENTLFDVSATMPYFPLIYIPQVFGILVGKIFGVSVYEMYQLSKFITLFFSFGIIAFTIRYYNVPPLSLAFLSLPISLFQFSSTNPDGIIFSLSFLIGAMFISYIDPKKALTRNRFIIFYPTEAVSKNLDE